MTVLSVVQGRNAELIAQAASLWIRPQDLVMDVTLGRGLWWTQYQHDGDFIGHDIALDGVDFRSLPEKTGSVDVVTFDPPYVCVSLDTEILTDRGWKKYDEVIAVAHSALTLNMSTGKTEWNKIEKIGVYPAGNRMVSIEGNAHSSLTTPNHRWPVQSKKSVLTFIRSDGFKVDHRVPIKAEYADAPTTSVFSDALVEVVSWFWTEGTIERAKDGVSPLGYCNIVQKFDTTDNCDRIRAALSGAFGLPVEKFPRVGRVTDGVPRWRESRDGHKAVFWLSSDAGRLVQSLAPERVPTHSFLLSLTPSQLKLFVEVSMLADGHTTLTGARSLGQKSRAAAEAFQFAAILAGHATSIRPYRTPYGYDMHTVRLKMRSTFKPSRNTVTIVDAPTAVWCPVTTNGTWLARRNGTTYFTGNCVGGRETTTIPDMHNRFGLTNAPDSPGGVDQLIADGLSECARVLTPRGRLFLKSCNYVSSGKYHTGHLNAVNAALSDGWFVVVDEFVHHGGTGPQPKTNRDGSPRRQVHSRRAHSFLTVFTRTNKTWS